MVFHLNNWKDVSYTVSNSIIADGVINTQHWPKECVISVSQPTG